MEHLALTTAASVGVMADSMAGNFVLIGFAVVGLIGSGLLLGTARTMRAEAEDPLNQRHSIEI